MRAGETAGFRQHYTALSDGRLWFEAVFTGHVSPAAIGLEPLDSIDVRGPYGSVHLEAKPGLNPQRGSAAVVANSVRRVVAAPPGWQTVGDLPPAVPV